MMRRQKEYARDWTTKGGDLARAADNKLLSRHSRVFVRPSRGVRRD
jgi:hypothetical protein